MKKVVILFLILLPQWVWAADCEYFTIDNEMLLFNDLDWNINNNGACTKNHISGVVYSLAGAAVVRTDMKNAIIGLKPVGSWDGWYHYHVSIYPNASVVTVYGSVDDWHADWTSS